VPLQKSEQNQVKNHVHHVLAVARMTAMTVKIKDTYPSVQDEDHADIRGTNLGARLRMMRRNAK
jgi:hypothetical protein